MSAPHSTSRYSLYGLGVRSEVRLPLSSLTDSAEDVDLRIELAESPSPEPSGALQAEAHCTDACHAGAAYSRAWRGEDGVWMWHDAVGTLHLSRDARHVRVWRQRDCDPGALQMELMGPVMALVLHQRGYACLHASAIDTPGGVVAFLGCPGDGKSTMAAMHLAAGARLLGDDVLPIQLHDGEAVARPGLPLVKLWPESARGALAIDGELPRVTGRHDKRLLMLDQATAAPHAPMPLRAIYVLRRYEPSAARTEQIAGRELPPRAALAVLLAHTYRRELLQPDEVARLLPVYARVASTLPVRLLTYPSGFEYQAAVRDHIRLNTRAAAA